MPKTLVKKLSPGDHGKRMSLEDFEKAQAREGYLYELCSGVIVVSDVPKRKHLVQIKSLRKQLAAYDLAWPDVIDTIAAGGECKIVIPEFQSERHPDLCFYKTSCLDHSEDSLWSTWIPDVAIEVVSPGSEKRDYEEKRAEYLAAGIKEYWIIDVDRRELLVLRRQGSRWRARTVRSPETYTTRLLPGFDLDLAAIFEAADQVSE